MRTRLAYLGVACVLAAGPAPAQDESWSPVGGYAISAGLAGAAGGGMSDIAFAVDGRTLLATTEAGRTWVSGDGGETWALASAPESFGPLLVPAVEEGPPTSPEENARVVRHPYRAGVLFALGRDLYLSRDGGRTWAGLSESGSMPMIGAPQLAIAFDPFDHDRLYVANAFGLWRSSDGGLTWYGLNDSLPNFPGGRFEPGPRGAPPRVRSDRLGVAELAVGLGRWRRSLAAAVPSDPVPAGLDAPPAALWQDPQDEDVRLAALDGSNGTRVLRSLDGGASWDDLTANLPRGEIAAVTASSESGVIYVAGEAGVFSAMADLRNPSPPSLWQPLTGVPVSGRVADLYFEPAAGRLYALVNGYGVFQRRAPDVVSRIRALNAADLSTRPAAPGGLLTVQGAAVDAARVGGLPAPILATTGTEAQIQIPFRASGNEVELELTVGGGLEGLRLPFEQVSPAIFVDRGEPLVLRAGTGRLLDLANPARGGDRLLVLATGLGRVDPAWPVGVPAPLENPPSTVAAVAARLNGKPLRVVSSTLAGGYVGAYLVELELPTALNAGPAELTLEAGGRASNAVRLYVQP